MVGLWIAANLVAFLKVLLEADDVGVVQTH